jgi:hypothetical protein
LGQAARDIESTTASPSASWLQGEPCPHPPASTECSACWSIFGRAAHQALRSAHLRHLPPSGFDKKMTFTFLKR